MSNHNNHHDSRMMWLMMLFCVLPLAVLLFSGGFSGGYGWFGVAAIGAFIVGHFWFMRKGHQNRQDKDGNESHSSAIGVGDKDSTDKTREHKKNCCH